MPNIAKSSSNWGQFKIALFLMGGGVIKSSITPLILRVEQFRRHIWNLHWILVKLSLEGAPLSRGKKWAAPTSYLEIPEKKCSFCINCTNFCIWLPFNVPNTHGLLPIITFHNASDQWLSSSAGRSIPPAISGIWDPTVLKVLQIMSKMPESPVFKGLNRWSIQFFVSQLWPFSACPVGFHWKRIIFCTFNSTLHCN